MMLRSFIAVEIPIETQRTIAQHLAPLQKVLPRPLIRWVAPQNVHLTLKFLGDVSPVNLDRMAEALRNEANVHQAFSMSVGGLGAFPNSRRPRVIWIGLEAPSSLAALQHGVEAAAAILGYAAEDRAFSPHLTVGRVGQNASVADLHRIHTALEETKIGFLGEVKVETIHLFKSDLRPGGSVYTPLYVLPLKQ